jgi:hypothetical protein
MFRILFPLIVLIIVVVTILDIVKSTLSSDKKILWILIVIFVPLLGCLLYYAVGRK